MAWKVNDEPAVVFNGFGEVIRQIVPMLILFGVIHWSQDQLVGFMAVISVFLSFLTALFTRSQTVPTSTANKQIETALKLDSDATVNDVIAATKENK